MDLFARIVPPGKSGSKNPFADPAARHIARRLGMVLFLIALAVLFVATVIGFVVIRIQLSRKDAWPTDLPAPPQLLVLSTLVLIASSATLQWGLVRVRAGRPARLPTALGLTAGLGVLFLAVQVLAWDRWYDDISDAWTDSDGYRFALTGFYLFTGLHAAHVVGGLVPLIITASRASRGRYDEHDYGGVQYCAMYWHFLGVVWLFLYLTLWLGR